MKTVLLSTTSLWNCGDEFIREGVLELLQLKSNVKTIWWNRGYGIKNAYANSLDINLPLMDYFIVAGSPEWMYMNEPIYRYCLKHRVPLSIIGAGTRNIFGRAHRSLIRKIAQSGLCEVALARDKSAAKVFAEFGFHNIELIPDPAFFMKPLASEKKFSVLGWRDHFIDYEPSFIYRYPHRWLYSQIKSRISGRQLWGEANTQYDELMQQIFRAMPEPKIVILHDNREIEKAQDLFGKEYIFYSTDYREIFKRFATGKIYVGSRIHGSIPSLIHGASAYLLYSNTKAEVLNTSLEIWSKYIPNISEWMEVKYLKDNHINCSEFKVKSFDPKIITEAIEKEKRRIRKILKEQPILNNFIR